ncbi:MAG TPA: ABC transporter permease [Candidatus Sulfopaludibacter sp.]|jgi:predicted permease|nr:ABC transporter permease [Candidatus Sulfopaludibacter sp.]
MSWSRYFRRRHWDQERCRELDAYLQMETDDNVARGMSPLAARDAARRKLGNPTFIREEIYRMNTIGFLETLWHDLCYALRLLRLNPGFTFVAIASLALGIGANTAMFQLLDAVGLRTVPVKDSAALAIVKIADRSKACCSFNTRYADATTAIWEHIRDRQQAFTGLAAWGSYAFNLSTGGEIHLAQTLMVNGDFFQVLGVAASQGRVLSASDDQRGCAVPNAVISDAFWRRQFGGQPNVAGQTLTLEGHRFVIQGVTAPGFFGLEVGRRFDVAIPLCAEPLVQGAYSLIDKPWGWWLAVVGRLKPGWTVERASGHLAALSAGIFEDTTPACFDAASAKIYRDYRLKAEPGGQGYSDMRTDFEPALRILLVITALVLLIACANLANLMLARASARDREIAIRLAVGASRGRLVRQLLAESLLLSVAGALAGAAIAVQLNSRLVAFLTTRYGIAYLDLAPDWRILGFTASLAILTSMFFGLAPALRATRTSPGAAMKATSRSITAGPSRFGLRRILVVTQVALSLVLLVGALLFVRSFRNLMSVDAGFRQDGIVEADVDFSRLKLSPDSIHNFDRELLRRIRSVPGVDSAGHTNIMPLSGSAWQQPVTVNQKATGPVRLALVSPGYLRTMQTSILAGRDFDDRDTSSAPKVAIANESFARQFLAGDAVGKTFTMPRGVKDVVTSFQIVGLMRDSKYLDLREKAAPSVFLVASQEAEPDAYLPVVVHTSLAASAVIPVLKRAIAEVHPDAAYEFHIFRDEVRSTLQREQLMAALSGFFGILAALLATIGLYGVMSYMVARRKNEIGIRVALGAGRRDVIGMVLREAGLLVGAGLVAGTLLAYAAARAADALLFGLKPRDPLTFAFSIGLLAAVAAAASYLPALRAANLDPTSALREE